MTVGEGSGVTYENALTFVKAEREEIDMVYHFQLAARKRPPFTIESFRKIQSEWMKVIENNGWAVQYLSNHDSQRHVSRYGNDKEFRKESAKALATLTLTCPGTPFLYQGEEIGMVNVAYDDISDYNCCYTIGDYHSMIANGKTKEEAMAFIVPRSRDNARTPYQWNGSENAGFTTGKPWIKVNPKYTDINLEKDMKDPDSIFAYYKKAIALRKEHPAIIEGNLKFHLENDPQIIMYTRECEKETLLVIVNLSDNNAKLDIPEEIKSNKWERLITNRENLAPSLDGNTDVLPWNVEVYKKL